MRLRTASYKVVMPERNRLGNLLPDQYQGPPASGLAHRRKAMAAFIQRQCGGECASAKLQLFRFFRSTTPSCFLRTASKNSGPPFDLDAAREASVLMLPGFYLLGIDEAAAGIYVAESDVRYFVQDHTRRDSDGAERHTGNLFEIVPRKTL